LGKLTPVFEEKFAQLYADIIVIEYGGSLPVNAAVLCRNQLLNYIWYQKVWCDWWESV